VLIIGFAVSLVTALGLFTMRQSDAQLTVLTLRRERGRRKRKRVRGRMRVWGTK
jgi:hypothetical protein